MQSINFDNGYKTYAINGDENNVIRVNFADTNLANRINELLSSLSAFGNNLPENGNELNTITQLDRLMKSKIDEVFGKGVSQAVFGNINCLTVANDKGECICETFLNAIVPIIQSDMEQAIKVQSRHISDMVDKQKISKYTGDIK